MNRRNFLKILGCGCLGFGVSSCSTAPITERKQLKIISEAKFPMCGTSSKNSAQQDYIDLYFLMIGFNYGLYLLFVADRYGRRATVG